MQKNKEKIYNTAKYRNLCGASVNEHCANALQTNLKIDRNVNDSRNRKVDDKNKDRKKKNTSRHFIVSIVRLSINSTLYT